MSASLVGSEMCIRDSISENVCHCSLDRRRPTMRPPVHNVHSSNAFQGRSSICHVFPSPLACLAESHFVPLSTTSMRHGACVWHSTWGAGRRSSEQWQTFSEMRSMPHMGERRRLRGVQGVSRAAPQSMGGWDPMGSHLYVHLHECMQPVVYLVLYM